MIGDSEQKDNYKSNKDFISYGEYLSKYPFGNKVKLTNNYRGKFSRTAEEFQFSD